LSAPSAVLATGLSRFTQIEEDARGTENAVARDERRSNQSQESSILLDVVGNRLLQPLVVAARGDTKHPTHGLHAVTTSMGLDELVRRADAPGAWLGGHRYRTPMLPMLNDCPLNPGNSTPLAIGGLWQAFAASLTIPLLERLV
jgi:hypothetical protein